jgi:DNA repair protein RadC
VQPAEVDAELQRGVPRLLDTARRETEDVQRRIEGARRAKRVNARSAGCRSSLALDEMSIAELCAIVAGARDELGDGWRTLVAAGGLSMLARAHPAHLRSLASCTREQSLRLAAAFALGRRVEAARSPPRPDLRSPARVHELLLPEMRGLAQETFHVLLLDGKHRLRRRERVSAGTLTSSLVHPREVFGPALREAAAALVVAHNHPSGDPEPSSEDLAVTRRLIEAGRLVGVPLLDHVVVAEQGYVSIRERIAFD